MTRMAFLGTPHASVRQSCPRYRNIYILYATLGKSMDKEHEKQARWEIIIDKLEKGEINEDQAQEEIMRAYGTGDTNRVNPCN